MFLKKIKTEGIAHLSYIIGSQDSAAVIDPRRDIDIYLSIAAKYSVNITHIFETHRNEDYVIGSVPLSQATGADIYHGGKLDFKYGNSVKDGDYFEIGELSLKIFETPGHTFESISIALYDPNFGNKAVGVFTGDALFIGDVGRTDFFPDRAEEVAGLLYNSIFNKILPLGGQAIIYPAHGAGSVCGSGMASREFSTLGYEKMFNPVLQKTCLAEFVDYKVNEKHNKPPYFKMMERYNLEGPPLKQLSINTRVLTADEFDKRHKNGMQILDTRSPEAICGTYIPNSLAIPLNMIPAFAGWFLSYKKPIGIIASSGEEVATAIKHLYRLGYDDIAGYLGSGLHQWEVEGKEYHDIPAIYISNLVSKLESKDDFILLDVRSKEEYDEKHLPNSKNIYIGHLPEHINELDKNKKIVTFCGSGRRAIIAASILKTNGFEDVENCLGSMMACKKVGCPTE